MPANLQIFRGFKEHDLGSSYCFPRGVVSFVRPRDLVFFKGARSRYFR